MGWIPLSITSSIRLANRFYYVISDVFNAPAYFSCIGPRICIRFLILFCPRVFLVSFRYLIPFNRKAPVLLLIRRTAFRYWWLIVLNIVSSMVEAVTEGATLAVIFLAVDTLASSGNNLSKLMSNPLF